MSSFGPLGGTKKGPWTVSWYGFSLHRLSSSPRILAEICSSNRNSGVSKMRMMREAGMVAIEFKSREINRR